MQQYGAATPRTTFSDVCPPVLEESVTTEVISFTFPQLGGGERYIYVGVETRFFQRRYSLNINMHFSTLAILVALVATASAQTLYGQYDCMAAGAYQLCQNLWGECTYSTDHHSQAIADMTHAAAGVGGQNSTLLSTSGNTVSWRTQWTWQNNPNNVKSYANLLSNSAKGVQVRFHPFPYDLVGDFTIHVIAVCGQVCPDDVVVAV